MTTVKPIMVPLLLLVLLVAPDLGVPLASARLTQKLRLPGSGLLYFWGAKATSGEVLKRIVAPSKEQALLDKEVAQSFPVPSAPATFQFLDITTSDGVSIARYIVPRALIQLGCQMYNRGTKTIQLSKILPLELWLSLEGAISWQVVVADGCLEGAKGELQATLQATDYKGLYVFVTCTEGGNTCVASQVGRRSDMRVNSLTSAQLK